MHPLPLNNIIEVYRSPETFCVGKGVAVFMGNTGSRKCRMCGGNHLSIRSTERFMTGILYPLDQVKVCSPSVAGATGSGVTI